MTETDRPLTLAEKARLTSGHDTWTSSAAPGVPSFRMADGPHGLRVHADRGDHLGLQGSLPATCFPPAVTLGSAWDPGLAERVGAAIAREAKAAGVDVVLGPGINIKRSPLCGRNFEYFSEDPLVAAEMGAALVRGLQGAGVGASLKHFAANNQETDRLRVSADIDERPLREIYLRAFERVVRRARPWTVMSSYNALNGVPVSENRWLLTEVLREEWGFDGVVVSDWGAVHDRVEALAAGLDLQMPSTQGRGDREIEQAVARGELDEAVLDRSVARITALARRAAASRAPDTDPGHDGHHALAREVAARGTVLLKNDGPVLPLDPAAGPVAVVGELARTPVLQGGGSARVEPVRVETALDHLRERLGAAWAGFAPGYPLAGASGAGRGGAEPIADAVRLAASARTTLVFLGPGPAEESEGFDRDHLDLPAPQTELLEAVLEAAERVVVVLSNGGTVRVTPWADRVDALVEAWLPGQAGGAGLADVLLGDAEPSGRLTETVPLRLEDVPSHLNFPGEEGRVRYGEGIFVGYRGYDARDLPVAFPFGHGLSYTAFAYSGLSVRREGEEVRAALTVANTGDRPGREVVQLYTAGPADSGVARPVRELRAFTGVTLAPGERREVELAVPVGDLAYYSIRDAGWRVEPGTYRFEAGASSRDIRLSADLDLDGGPDRELTAESTLAEWRAHPAGGPLLTEALSTAGDAAEQTRRLLADPSVRRIAEQMSLAAIAAIPGSPITEEDLEKLVERLHADGGAD